MLPTRRLGRLVQYMLKNRRPHRAGFSRSLLSGPGSGLLAFGLLGCIFLAPGRVSGNEPEPAPTAEERPPLEEPGAESVPVETGLLIGDGVVLRPVAGGVAVERSAPEGGRLTVGLLLAIGIGLGLGASVPGFALLHRWSGRPPATEPRIGHARMFHHAPRGLKPRTGAGTEDESAPEPRLSHLMEAVKTIEYHLAGLDAANRGPGKKRAEGGAWFQEPRSRATSAGTEPVRDRNFSPASELLPEAGPPDAAEPEIRPGDRDPGPPDRDGDEDLPDIPGLNPHARARHLRNLGGRMMNDGLWAGAEANFSRSLSIMKKLVHQEPDNQVYLRDLVLAYHNQGRVLEQMDQLAAAADYFQRAVRLTASLAERYPDSCDWRRGLAASHGHLGRIQNARGQLKEAARSLEKEVDIMRGLVEKKPDSKPWSQALAGSLHNLSLVRERAGAPEEALQGYREAMALMRRLMEEEDPGNYSCARNLGAVCGTVGRLLKDMGRIQEALEAVGEYTDLMRGLVKGCPGDAALKRELTVAIGQTGRLHELAGDFEPALACFEEALKIRLELAAGSPGDAGRQRDLVVGLCKVGDAHFAGCRWDEALSGYDQAMELIEFSEKKFGPKGVWRIEKCSVLLRLGNYYKNRDGLRALDYYQRALALAAPQAKADGDSVWSELEASIKENMGR